MLFAVFGVSPPASAAPALVKSTSQGSSELLTIVGATVTQSDLNGAAQAASGALSQVEGARVWLLGRDSIMLTAKRLPLAAADAAESAMDAVGARSAPTFSARPAISASYRVVLFTPPPRGAARVGAFVASAERAPTSQSSIDKFGRSIATRLVHQGATSIMVFRVGAGSFATLWAIALEPTQTASSADWSAYLTGAVAAFTHVNPSTMSIESISLAS